MYIYVYKHCINVIIVIVAQSDFNQSLINNFFHPIFLKDLIIFKDFWMAEYRNRFTDTRYKNSKWSNLL